VIEAGFASRAVKHKCGTRGIALKRPQETSICGAAEDEFFEAFKVILRITL
jgi:hypothetical protein